jgi:hypothetical protein
LVTRYSDDHIEPVLSDDLSASLYGLRNIPVHPEFEIKDKLSSRCVVDTSEFRRPEELTHIGFPIFQLSDGTHIINDETA